MERFPPDTTARSRLEEGLTTALLARCALTCQSMSNGEAMPPSVAPLDAETMLLSVGEIGSSGNPKISVRAHRYFGIDVGDLPARY